MSETGAEMIKSAGRDLSISRSGMIKVNDRSEEWGTFHILAQTFFHDHEGHGRIKVSKNGSRLFSTSSLSRRLGPLEDVADKFTIFVKTQHFYIHSFL